MSKPNQNVEVYCSYHDLAQKVDLTVHSLIEPIDSSITVDTIYMLFLILRIVDLYVLESHCGYRSYVPVSSTFLNNRLMLVLINKIAFLIDFMFFLFILNIDFVQVLFRSRQLSL